ncbi:hypothetical protein BS78_01G127200 [Paspalum vaginatum]|nr:hypothetical protein BS78_01G127200 [Paspalum vaginatum]
MPTLTSDPIISSPRWGVPFCVGRSSGGPRSGRPPSSTGGSGQGLGCGRPLDRVAGWVGGCIAAVFFASLERCWCVNVRTHDDEQRDAEAPLMFGGGSGSSTAGAGCLERRKGSWRSGKGRRAGGGMGCYGDF